MNEKRINIMDPEIPQVVSANQETQKEPEVKYATITERFVALLIDYGVVFFPAQFIGGLVLKMMGPQPELWQILSIFVGINVAFILYETILSCGDRVTLGKSLVGVAVVKKDLSGPISFPRAFLRAIGYYVSAILFLGGFFFAFFEEHKRSLHDFLAGSVVVQIRQKTFLETTVVRLLGGLLMATFGWVVYSQYFSGGALLQGYYIRKAEEHLQKIAFLEEGHYSRYGYYTNDLLRLSLLTGDPVQFQRDTRKVLAPRGFKIGVQKDGYKISGIAKDNKHTPVYFQSK